MDNLSTSSSRQKCCFRNLCFRTKGTDEKIITRAGASISQLAENCLKDPVGNANGVKLATISSEMLDVETGTKFVRVSLNDLVRFRRAYNERPK